MTTDLMHLLLLRTLMSWGRESPLLFHRSPQFNCRLKVKTTVRRWGGSGWLCSLSTSLSSFWEVEVGQPVSCWTALVFNCFTFVLVFVPLKQGFFARRPKGILVERGDWKWDEGNTKQKVRAWWCCHSQTCQRFSGQHSRRWLWMSIARGLECQSSGSSSGHRTPWVKMPNVIKVLEKRVALIEKFIFSWKYESKFCLLEQKKIITPKPEIAHTQSFEIWKAERDHYPSTPQRLICGEGDARAEAFAGEVWESPSVNIVLAAFPVLFTNWYSGSCLCCR